MNGSYTAVNSQVINRKGGSGLTEALLQPSFVIRSFRSFEGNALSIQKARFRLWDQEEWAPWGSLTVETPEDTTADVVIKQHPIAGASTEFRGTKISLVDGSDRFHDTDGPLTIEQHSEFVLEFPEPVTIDDFIDDWLNPLSFLLASGTRRTSGVQTARIHNPEWRYFDGSGVPEDGELPELAFIPRNPKKHFSDDDPVRLLHRFPDFDFAEQIPAVFETYERHGHVVELYLDFIHFPPSGEVNQLATLAQLVESFDRSLNPDEPDSEATLAEADAVHALLQDQPALKKHAARLKRATIESARPTFASRLKRMDEQSGKFVTQMVGNKTWREHVPAVRNSLIHGLPNAKFFATNRIPIQVSIDILRFLFEVRLLVALGFSTEKAKEVRQGEPRYWGESQEVVKYLEHFDAFRAYKPDAEVAGSA